jgi:molybdenum cofactor cytidylyltransferase
MALAAVVLAAGEGTRYTASGGSGHKLLAEFRGRPVIAWAVEHALRAGVGPVHVVVGAVDLPSSVLPSAVHVIENPRWAEGMATSLHAAVAAARTAGHDAVVVGLGDQPLVAPESWRLVAQCDAPIAVATYNGRRGHPVRLGTEVWPLLPGTGDMGARHLIREHPEFVTEVPCPGCSADVDTVEDLSRWS